jgi:predicted AAA+ superfamily ATPase
MDPLGFGLENFDAIGRWRDKDGAFPVDPSGTLPDGKTFNGPDQLKDILVANRDAFTQGMAEKMMIYALGRGLDSSDRPAVRAVAQQVAQNRYRISSMVLGIVNSVPFQQRKGDRSLP